MYAWIILFNEVNRRSNHHPAKWSLQGIGKDSGHRLVVKLVLTINEIGDSVSSVLAELKVKLH